MISCNSRKATYFHGDNTLTVTSNHLRNSRSDCARSFLTCPYPAHNLHTVPPCLGEAERKYREEKGATADMANQSPSVRSFSRTLRVNEAVVCHPGREL